MRKEKFGSVELEILKLLIQANHAVPYWSIVKSLCGKEYTEACRVSVTRALRKLRKAGFLRKRRYMGDIVYSLTPSARKWLLDFCPEG